MPTLIMTAGGDAFLNLGAGTRLAFRFGRISGRVSGLHSANDVIDQLQQQLDAERRQHKFNISALEQEKAILVRDLLQAKYEIAQRNLVETFSKMESPSAMLH
jgi:hypothetical protein